jgi:hypothetical protein
MGVMTTPALARETQNARAAAAARETAFIFPSRLICVRSCPFLSNHTRRSGVLVSQNQPVVCQGSRRERREVGTTRRERTPMEMNSQPGAAIEQNDEEKYATKTKKQEIDLGEKARKVACDGACLRRPHSWSGAGSECFEFQDAKRNAAHNELVLYCTCQSACSVRAT